MPPATRRRAALAVLCGVQFVDVLGVTSTTTAIPAVVAGLEAPAAATALLATAYAAVFGGMLVLGARLGDRYGHRRVLLVGIAAFAAAGAAGAAAQDVLQLVAAVAVRGAAAAVGVPCALTLLVDATPNGAHRRTAVAAWGATGALAGTLGYVVGGVLTEVLSWRAVFGVNLPVGLALLAGVAAVVPAGGTRDSRRQLDLPGAALLTLAVIVLIAGASLLDGSGTRPAGAAAAAAGTLLGAAFAVRQRRAHHPLIPRTAYASRNLRTGVAISFVNTATTSSAGVLASLLLQQQRGATPSQAAWTLMPFSIAVIVGSFAARPLGGRLAPRRLAAAGLVAIAAGDLVLALTAGAVGGVVAGVSVAGAGLGLAAVAATAVGTDVPAELTGSASGLLNTGAQLGTALGVAALVAFSAHTVTGTAVAWAVAATAAAATAVAVLRVSTSSRRLGSDARAT